MGGSSRSSTRSAANGIVLCGSGTTGCHGHVESHRDEARDHGWIVKQHEEPCDVPVTRLGFKYRLDEDGSAHRVTGF